MLLTDVRFPKYEVDPSSWVDFGAPGVPMLPPGLKPWQSGPAKRGTTWFLDVWFFINCTAMVATGLVECSIVLECCRCLANCLNQTFSVWSGAREFDGTLRLADVPSGSTLFLRIRWAAATTDSHPHWFQLPCRWKLWSRRWRRWFLFVWQQPCK